MPGPLQLFYLLDEIAKIGNHFRRATGKIDNWDVSLCEPIDDPINRLACHDFLALWPGVHVTMHADEIAKLAYVHLEDLGPPAAKCDRVLRQFL